MQQSHGWKANQHNCLTIISFPEFPHAHPVVDGGPYDAYAGANDGTEDRPVLGLLCLRALLLMGISHRIRQLRVAWNSLSGWDQFRMELPLPLRSIPSPAAPSVGS